MEAPRASIPFFAMPATAIERHQAALRAMRPLPPDAQAGRRRPAGRRAGSCSSARRRATGSPLLGRPFAWTAGKTLFKWFSRGAGLERGGGPRPDIFRGRLPLFSRQAAQGRRPRALAGGDRRVRAVARARIRASPARARDPRGQARDRALPRGRRRSRSSSAGPFACASRGREADCIPLPHPSGASPWHRMEPGMTLLARGLGLIAGASRRRRSFLDARARLCTLVGHAPPPVARRALRPGLRPRPPARAAREAAARRLDYVEKTWPQAKKSNTGIRYIVEKEGNGPAAHAGRHGHGELRRASCSTARCSTRTRRQAAPSRSGSTAAW